MTSAAPGRHESEQVSRGDRIPGRAGRRLLHPGPRQPERHPGGRPAHLGRQTGDDDDDGDDDNDDDVR